MASVFDLFGTLNLETRAFENSIRSVASRLDAADKALDSTIARSNKLGDTSATVARRYEKLGEGIAAQRQRLINNALAFEKGEINARKFASVVTSVDNAIAGMNSRIKDANARITELSETGFTHFQNQIQGAVGPQSTDLFKRLSSFQKTQLSFQLNDIITGLASGQNPLQILAQQGGQIVQIFQQGKMAQEGVAAATSAAAASQSAFATSSALAATHQSAIATSSAATAASMTEAAGATTVLGYSLVGVATTLAAGLVSILAAWKASKDILETAQKRLKLEQDVTAEWNKQYGLIGQIKKELEDAAKERSFGTFVRNASLADLQGSRSAIFSQLEANQKRITDEMARRQQLVAAMPSLGSNYVAEASKLGTLTPEQVKSLTDQLKAIDEQIYNEKRRLNDEHNKNVIEGAMRSAASVREFDRKAAQDAAAEAKKEREKMVKESIQKAKEFAEQVKNAANAAVSIFAATTENPFARIFLEGTQAINQMREATKGLGSDIQSTLAGLIQQQAASRAFTTQMNNALKSLGLREEAQQFLGGRSVSVSETLQRQLRAIGAGNPFSGGEWFNMVRGAVGSRITGNDANQRERDRKIIELTRGLDPKQLTPAQRQIAAAARLREADRVDLEKEEDRQIRKQLVEALNKINGNKALQIDIKDEGKRTAVTATSANVEARYK